MTDLAVIVVAALVIVVAPPALAADAPAPNGDSAAVPVDAQPVSPPARHPTSAPAEVTQKVAALIVQLADDDFKVRDRASTELVALGEDGELAMQAALKRSDLSPSARSVIEGILANASARKLTGPTLVTVGPPGATAVDAIQAALSRGKLKLTPASAEALGKKPDDRHTPGPDKPEPMWNAVLRLARDAGMTIESISPDEGSVSLVPADASAVNVIASGPFLLGLSRVETTIRRARDLPGIRPMNANNNDWAAPPCRLYLFAYAEPRLSTPSWIVESVEATTDDGKQLTPLNFGAPSGNINARYETQVSLKGEIAGSKALARVEIKARMLRQTATEHIELGDLFNVKNQTYPIGGGRAVVDQFIKVTDDQYEYKVSLHRGAMSPADWRSLQALMERNSVKVLDAAGKQLMQMGGSGSYSNDDWSNQTRIGRRFGAQGANVPGEPVKLVWDVPKEFQALPATFTFKDVPLQ